MHAALDTKIALDEAHLEIIDAPMGTFRNNGQSRGERIWIVLVRERSEGYGVAGALLTDDYFGECGSKVEAVFVVSMPIQNVGQSSAQMKGQISAEVVNAPKALLLK